MATEYGIRSSEVDQIIEDRERRAFWRGVVSGVLVTLFVCGLILLLAVRI